MRSPPNAPALHQAPALQEAAALLQQGRFREALTRCERAIGGKARPDVLLLNLAAAAAHFLGLAERAEHYLRQAIEGHPDHAESHNNLGNLLREQKRFEAAHAAFQTAIALRPNLAEAHNNLGIVCQERGLLDDAEASLRKALAIRPAYPEAWINLGIALREQGKLAEAESSFRQALALNARIPEAHLGLASVLLAQAQYDRAEAAYRQALSLRPDYADAHFGLGLLHDRLDRPQAAEASFRQTIALAAEHAAAYNNLAGVLLRQERFGEAEAAYRAVLTLTPKHGHAMGQAWYCAASRCAWQHHEADRGRILAAMEDGVAGMPPLVVAALPAATPAQQLGVGLRYGEHFLKNAVPLAHQGDAPRPTASRLRIGYLSADFHDHATMHLLGGVLAAHDRSAFAIHAYSYGPDRPDDSRRRQALAACEVFRDLRSLTDRAAAELIAADGIDILIDLKGYTQGSRLGITARRPAPIIVNWLGYPGTLGHPRLADFIIGDPVVTPLAHAAHFSETIVQMPHCYQPNDRQRPIGAKPSRNAAGLPEHGFVFCSFNQSYKLNPESFDVWCRLLRELPGSVLWLLEPPAEAIANLRREAETRGVSAERLIFAPKLAHTEHLGRLQLADLALDTFPYTSHTTGSDALWAVVPMVTRMGETFASRVGASLLTAANLPELVTDNWNDYFELAKSLAGNAERLADLRARLAEERLRAPLFDTKAFARDLEATLRRIGQAATVGQTGVR